VHFAKSISRMITARLRKKGASAEADAMAGILLAMRIRSVVLSRKRRAINLQHLIFLMIV